MQGVDLDSMNPTARARLIYSQARAEVSNRLWQAAIGGKPEGMERSDAARGIGQAISLETMLTSLGAGKAQALAAMEPDAVLATGCRTADVLPVFGSVIQTSKGIETSGSVGGLGANAAHSAALERAAERSGIPSPALAAIIDAEAAKRSDGSWNLFSRNPRSSAAGLGQFLSPTWIGMAQREGTWLHQVAQDRGWLDGKGHVPPKARGPLLALRYDAEASINTIADYARTNIDHIRRSGVKISNNPAELAKLAYLGHHLGPGDAVRFLAGGLSERRAATLLKAQIGAGQAANRITAAGGATSAHRSWLNNYVASHIRPDRFVGGNHSA